jgi:hypothetical protein
MRLAARGMDLQETRELAVWVRVLAKGLSASHWTETGLNDDPL